MDMQALVERMTRKGAVGLLLAFALGLSACATVPAESSAAGERHVTIATPDGSADALLFTPAKAKAPAVILWGDLAGLRPAVAEIGRRLAAEGYVVLAPNAFYRSVKLDGTTATKLDFATRNKEWRGTATDERIMSDAKAYLAYLDNLPRVNTRVKAGAVGYEIGSVHAFLTARVAPDRIAAVAAIQPLAIATARPNSPHLFVNQSKAAYYVAIGKNADAREPGDKTDLAKAFADAGLKGTVEVLSGDHGFALSDNAKYDEASAERAWAATLALLRENLK
jgi:carboxymethylenebutenolidase